MDAQQLFRLMVIDTQLATTGVDLPSTALKLGVAPETICRDLELLLSVGCELTFRQTSAGDRCFYAGQRLFNPQHGAVSVSAMISGDRTRRDLLENPSEPEPEAQYSDGFLQGKADS